MMGFSATCLVVSAGCSALLAASLAHPSAGATLSLLWSWACALSPSLSTLAIWGLLSGILLALLHIAQNLKNVAAEIGVAQGAQSDIVAQLVSLEKLGQNTAKVAQYQMKICADKLCYAEAPCMT